MNILNKILIILALTTNLVFAAEETTNQGKITVDLAKSDTTTSLPQKKNFAQFYGGANSFDSELYSDTSFIGVAFGQRLFAENEDELPLKWFFAFDYGQSGSNLNEYSMLNTVLGANAIIDMGTPLATFNIGPVIGSGFVKTSIDSEWAVLFGIDANFSFFPKSNFSLDVGTRALFPVFTINDANNVDLYSKNLQLYASFTFYYNKPNR